MLLNNQPDTNKTREELIAELEALRTEVKALRQNAAKLPSQAGIDIQQCQVELTQVQNQLAQQEQIEEALRQSEERFRRAILDAPLPIMIHAEDGEVLQISRVWTEISGYEPEDIPTIADWAEKAYGARQDLARGEIERLYSLNQRIAQGEYIITTKSGETRIWEFNSAPLGQLPDGRRLAISTAFDITSRKQAEAELNQAKTELEIRVQERTKALLEVNERLLLALNKQSHTQKLLREQAQLLDVAHDTIITRDWDGTITFWNRGAESMYGWKKAEALRQPIHTLLQTQLPKNRTEIEAELLSKGYWEGELIHKKKEGTFITVASRWVVQRDEEGQPIKILEINNDITAQKKAELALRQSEEKFRQLAENIQDVFWMSDIKEKRVIYASPAYEQIWGRSCEDLYQNYTDWLSPIHPEDRQRVEAGFFEWAAERGYDEEYRIIQPDGSICWIRDRAFPVKNESGEVYRLAGIAADITARKLAKEALQRSEAKFRSLSECAPIGIFLMDKQGKCVYTNPRCQAIVGCTFEEALGEGWQQFIHPEDREAILIQWVTTIAEMQEGFYNEIRYLHKDETIRFGQVRTVPVLTGEGEFLGHVGTVEDITESRVLELMKREFISIVSHELRTPLTSIWGSLGLLANGVYENQPQKGQRMLQIAVTQTERLVRLVNDILDLERLESGKVKLVPQSCKAADLMVQAVDLMRSLAEQNHITLSVTPLNVQVWAAPDSIIQTLTNLLANAIKFSPPHTTIWLDAVLVDTQTATEANLPKISPPYVLFRVKDQGRGIPLDKIESIFGQFQQVDASDSRQKGGTGLGLAICRSIVQQHGGQIWAESGVGEGSTFYFTLSLPPG